MKRNLLLVFFIALLSVTVLAQVPSKAPKSSPTTKTRLQPWEAIKQREAALREFHPQQPRRIDLPNGMVLMLQPDHELPLIDGLVLIRGGSRLEPAEKVGLVSVYGEAWRTGGTSSKTGDQLDDFLEMRGASVETGVGLESTNLSWSSLKKDFDDVFPIILDLIQHPQFRDEKIALTKS